MSQIEAKQGRNRQWQWRTFIVSTAITAIVLFGAYFLFLA